MTLPIIHLLKQGGPQATALVHDIVRQRHVDTENWSRLKTLLAEHQSIEYAYSRAVEFGEAAKRHLKVFPDSPERDALMALADYVLYRDR